MNRLKYPYRIGILTIWAILQFLLGAAWATSYPDMIARREIRIAVEYDRTLYYSNRGSPYGLAIDLAADLSAWLSERHPELRDHRPIIARIVPLPRGETLAALTDGRADIALGEMRFSRPVIDPSALIIQPSAVLQREVLVTGSPARRVTTISDLAGLEIHAAFGSRVASAVDKLNQQLENAGSAPIRLITLPHELADEDLLQMTNAGLIDSMIVQDWKAQLWKQALPDIHVSPDIEFQAEGLFGWAVLQSNADLAADLEKFVTNLVATDGMGKFRINAYRSNARTLKNPAATKEWIRFEKLRPLFQKYGEKYSLNPLMVAALGFQETTLDPDARGSGGAIGVMQLMPATGHAMQVGDIQGVESNIHAASKYMDQLLREYFPMANFSEKNRTLFAIASYNAGPRAIASIRDQAAAEGFDPNVWLGSVEIIAARNLGVGVMTYVRNVYKYFVSYQLAIERKSISPKGN